MGALVKPSFASSWLRTVPACRPTTSHKCTTYRRYESTCCVKKSTPTKSTSNQSLTLLNKAFVMIAYAFEMECKDECDTNTSMLIDDCERRLQSSSSGWATKGPLTREERQLNRNWSWWRRKLLRGQSCSVVNWIVRSGMSR